MKFHKWTIGRDGESVGDGGGRRRGWTDPWWEGRRESEREGGEARPSAYIPPDHVGWERTLKD